MFSSGGMIDARIYGLQRNMTVSAVGLLEFAGIQSIYQVALLNTLLENVFWKCGRLQWR